MLPVIAPGCEGTLIGETAKDVTGPDPQIFVAETVMFPAVAVGVVVRVLVGEEPLQPDGVVHV